MSHFGKVAARALLAWAILLIAWPNAAISQNGSAEPPANAQPPAGQATPPSQPPANGNGSGNGASNATAAAGAAQPTPTGLDERLSSIDAHIAALEAQETRSEQEEAELTELRSAAAFLRQAKSERQRADEFQQLNRGVPDRARQVEETLTTATQTLQQPPTIAKTPTGGAEALTAELTAVEAQLSEAQLNLQTRQQAKQALELDAETRNARRNTIPDELAAARLRLEEVQGALDAAPSADASPAVTAARRNALLAEATALEQTIRRLEEEVRSYDARRSLLDLRRRLAQAEVDLAQRAVEELTRHASLIRTSLADIRREEARRAEAEATNPVVAGVRQTNIALADELAEIAQTRDQLQREIDDYRAKTTLWQTRLRRVQEQDARGGLTDVIGIRLRNQREQVPDPQMLRERLDEITRLVRDAQSRRFELEDERFDNIEVAARQAMAESDPRPAARDAVEPELMEALREKQTLINELLATYALYIDETLTDLYTSIDRGLLDAATSYLDFVDERIFWIKSTDQLNADDFAAARAVLWDLFDPAELAALGRDIISAQAEQWPSTSFLIVLVIALGVARRRARRWLAALAAPTKNPFSDRFRFSMLALLATIIISLFWPALIWSIGQLVEQGNDSGRSVALRIGFNRAAIIMLAADLLRQLCRTGGLADVHFGWRPASLKLVRREISWALPVGLVLAFLLGASLADPTDERDFNSLGRLAFIAGMVVFATITYRLLHPSKGIAAGFIQLHPSGWLARLRYLWFGMLVLIPLVLAGASVVGYLYTAVELEQRVIQTAWFIIGAIAAYALFQRWILVTRRRLAIEQAQRRRAAVVAKAMEQARSKSEAGEGASTATAGSASADLPTIEEPERDVTAISAQAQRLLRTAMAIVMVIGVVAIWIDVLPALGVLNRVVLWTNAESAATAVAPTLTDQLTGNGGGASTNGGADQVVIAPPAIAPTTLADLGLALAILIATFIISQNLPGLLEMTILQPLPLTQAGRYTINMLTRYALVTVGILAAFYTINVGWSKVQWLVAAVGVGLGFGLQEIFANFVSGLIILTERPIRVGDTVTVGNLSGTVSRIRIRATTITDWDRKEIVIPNREFVTGQVVNWSLTDTLLRATIPVGIAYGSDTKLAEKLLLDVAEKHPDVLGDPPPRALFMAFGDSTLNFELRVFIPSIDYFLQVRSDLNRAIDDAFKANDIEIAFPQRDLHIRSIKAVLPIDRQGGEMRPIENPDRNGPQLNPGGASG